MREPISPETGSQRGASGQTETLRLGLLEQPRHHTACRKCLISAVPPCTASSWRKISVASLAMASAMSASMRAPFSAVACCGLPNQPVGGDRADVGEHRLIAAGAPQLVHLVAVAVIGRIADAVEMHEIGPVREHGQRLDLAAMGEAVAGMAVQFLGDVAGLHGQHRHAVLAVQRFRRNGKRRNIALVPVEDQQIFGAVLGGRHAGLRTPPAYRYRA